MIAYVGVFVAFALLAHAGLGVGHFFYVPICLVALATDGPAGVVAGVLAAGLYATAAIVGAGTPATHTLIESTSIRLVTYTLVGGLVGAYAKRNRVLVEQLGRHARQDFLTGLDNARVFDQELGRLCAARRPFTLLLADLQGLGAINEVHGHEAGNQALRRAADALRDAVGASGTLCRVGGDEFALLTTLPPGDVAQLRARASHALVDHRLALAFATTTCPEDGETAVELFHKADDRLFAAKLVSRNRRTVLSLAPS